MLTHNTHMPSNKLQTYPFSKHNWQYLWFVSLFCSIILHPFTTHPLIFLSIQVTGGRHKAVPLIQKSSSTFTAWVPMEWIVFYKTQRQSKSEDYGYVYLTICMTDNFTNALENGIINWEHNFINATNSWLNTWSSTTLVFLIPFAGTCDVSFSIKRVLNSHAIWSLRRLQGFSYKLLA